MPRIYISGNGIITLNEKTYYNSCEYKASFNDTLRFVFCPVLDDSIRSFAYAVVAEIKENAVSEISSGAKVIIYDNEDIEIRLTPPHIPQRCAPKVIAQNTINNNGEHVVTVYDDGTLQFLVEGTFGMFNNPLPYNLKDIKLKSSRNQNRGIILLTGKANSKDYALVMLIDTDYRLLCEYTADIIEITADGLKITNVYKDMLEHTIICTVNPVCTPQCISKVVESKWSSLNYSNELIPYMFLEALKIDAEDECLSYLSEDLKSGFENVKSYFGKIDEICPPKYAEYNLNRVSVISTADNINTAKYYDFVMNGSEIVNIEEISYNFIK